MAVSLLRPILPRANNSDNEIWPSFQFLHPILPDLQDFAIKLLFRLILSLITHLPQILSLKSMSSPRSFDYFNHIGSSLSWAIVFLFPA
jgi:hypothetical protein